SASRPMNRRRVSAKAWNRSNCCSRRKTPPRPLPCLRERDLAAATDAASPPQILYRGDPDAGVVRVRREQGYALMAIPIGPIGPLIDVYRKAWRAAGHPGDGEVMVAFHMFCHEDARLAREIARPPFEEYFRALNEAVGDWARGTTSKDYRDYDKSMR